MRRLAAAIRREIRLCPIWLTRSLAWSLGIVLAFLLVFMGAR